MLEDMLARPSGSSFIIPVSDAAQHASLSSSFYSTAPKQRWLKPHHSSPFLEDMKESVGIIGQEFQEVHLRRVALSANHQRTMLLHVVVNKSD